MTLSEENQSTKPWIAYVTGANFPDGGAGARRILGNAQSIYDTGRDVVIISGQKETDIKTVPPFFLKVISTGERNAEHLPQFLKRILYFVMGRSTFAWLNKQNTKPECVIIYSSNTPYILWMMYYCKKNNIPLVFDVVEWPIQEGLIKNLISPYQWNIELYMRLLLPKLSGLIVISKYLENYYTKKNVNLIRIPPTLDVLKINPNHPETQKKCMKISYTGTPGTKDSLNEVFEAISDLVSRGYDVILNLAGISDYDLLNYSFFKKNKISKIPSYILNHGVTTQYHALELIKSSDFSILFRKTNRVSSAGFSTKMVESLSVGTPLIANITGDMGAYLIDKINAIISPTLKVEDITTAIQRALEATENNNEYQSMRLNSRKLAEEQFDYRSHVVSFKNFLSNLQ